MSTTDSAPAQTFQPTAMTSLYVSGTIETPEVIALAFALRADNAPAVTVTASMDRATAIDAIRQLQAALAVGSIPEGH